MEKNRVDPQEKSPVRKNRHSGKIATRENFGIFKMVPSDGARVCDREDAEYEMRSGVFCALPLTDRDFWRLDVLAGMGRVGNDTCAIECKNSEDLGDAIDPIEGWGGASFKEASSEFDEKYRNLWKR